jgi:glycosyltransferase involved in cell wall biosynthesis
MFMTKDIKPKVLIIIATSIIGGPGKGLFQFFDFAPKEEFDYLLCDFSVKGKDAGDFEREAKRRNLNLHLLKQSHLYDPSLIFQTKRLVQQHGFNIIQTHGHKANFIGWFVKNSIQIPWLCFVHGWTDEDLKIRLYNRIDRWAIRGADRVVAVSEAMKAKLVGMGVPEQKITVIYNAIEDNGFYKDPPDPDLRKQFAVDDDTLLVGVIGRLSREKGQRIFLDAWEKVCERVPKTKAILIGDGPDRKVLEEICVEKGLQNRVFFVGHKVNPHPFYRILDLVVMPSLSEGLPNVPLEALAHKKAIVATSVGGTPEIIEDGKNGILVRPGDPNDLAEAILAMLGNSEKRNLMVAEGLSSLYPKFSPEHRAVKILSVYQELLS